MSWIVLWSCWSSHTAKRRAVVEHHQAAGPKHDQSHSRYDILMYHNYQLSLIHNLKPTETWKTLWTSINVICNTRKEKNQFSKARVFTGFKEISAHIKVSITKYIILGCEKKQTQTNPKTYFGKNVWAGPEGASIVNLEQGKDKGLRHSCRNEALFQGVWTYIFISETDKEMLHISGQICCMSCLLLISKSQMTAATPAKDLLADVHSLCNTSNCFSFALCQDGAFSSRRWQKGNYRIDVEFLREVIFVSQFTSA